jgi:hypothetical protein
MRRHLAWTITSSDSSQQRAQTFEAGGGRIIARCPFRVNERTRFRGKGWRRGRAITSAAVTL